MAFVEDSTAFLADFGVTCVAGVVPFMGILDQPDAEFDVGNSMIQSREFKLTYLTSAVSLKGGDPVSVDSVAYTVRSYPNTVDDGKWTEAMLSKT